MSDFNARADVWLSQAFYIFKNERTKTEARTLILELTYKGIIYALDSLTLRETDIPISHTITDAFHSLPCQYANAGWYPIIKENMSKWDNLYYNINKHDFFVGIEVISMMLSTAGGVLKDVNRNKTYVKDYKSRVIHMVGILCPSANYIDIMHLLPVSEIEDDNMLKSTIDEALHLLNFK